MFKFLLFILPGIFYSAEIMAAVKPSFDCANAQTEAEMMKFIPIKVTILSVRGAEIML